MAVDDTFDPTVFRTCNLVAEKKSLMQNINQLNRIYNRFLFSLQHTDTAVLFNCLHIKKFIKLKKLFDRCKKRKLKDTE